MCWFGGDDYKPGTGPPAVRPDQDEDTTLPTAKPIIDEDDKAETEFGSSKKESGQAAGNRASADSLRIELNTGDSGTGTNTGQGGRR